jgi:membrane-bound lytic murein transglycosylase D
MYHCRMFKNFTKLFISVFIITTLTNSAVANPHIRHDLAPSRSAWDIITNKAKLNEFHNHKRVEHFIKMYKQKRFHVSTVSERAEPYIFHIIEKLIQKGLPIELALLPMIESAFIADAQSNRGAAGIWQIQLATGEIYGLYEDQWFDSRQDVAKATNAAIEYLRELNERFKGDWLLALAAYNAGGGRVSQAIKRNIKAGKPTDFWSLELPQETKDFVPKFLAISNVIQNAKEYGISIAHVPNSPFFQLVSLPKQTDLRVIAKLSGLSLDEVKTLNPGFKTNLTRPNNIDHILLPVSNAKILARKINIEEANKKQATSKKITTTSNKTSKVTTTIKAHKNIKNHVVVNGDTLAKIAATYKINMQELMLKNKLTSPDLIIVGQVLIL